MKIIFTIIISLLLVIPVYAIERVQEVPATAITMEQVTTNAGSAVQLSATHTPTKSISVKALSTNTGIVYIGTSAVDSTNGRELEAGESLDMDVNNLTLVYIDTSVNGEGVSFIAIN